MASWPSSHLSSIKHLPFAFWKLVPRLPSELICGLSINLNLAGPCPARRGNSIKGEILPESVDPSITFAFSMVQENLLDSPSPGGIIVTLASPAAGLEYSQNQGGSDTLRGSRASCSEASWPWPLVVVITSMIF